MGGKGSKKEKKEAAKKAEAKKEEGSQAEGKTVVVEKRGGSSEPKTKKPKESERKAVQAVTEKQSGMAEMRVLGKANDPRVLAVRVTAALTGVQLEHVETESAKKGVSPSNTLPVLYQGDAVAAFSAGSIIRLLASTKGDDLLLGGKDLFKQAQVASWVGFSHDLQKLCDVATGNVDAQDFKGFPKEAMDAVLAAGPGKLIDELQKVERHLSTCTFLVDDRLSVADVSLCCMLVAPMSAVFSKKVRSSKLQNVTRWFETAFAQAGVGSLVGEFSLFDEKAKASKSAGGKGKGNAASLATVAVTSSAGQSGGLKTDVKMLFRRSYTRVKDLLYSPSEGLDYVDKQIKVCGWARTVREAQKGKIAFISLTDGSCFESLQVIATKGETEGFQELLSAGGTDSSHMIIGTVVKSPAKGQKVELKADAITVLGPINQDEYPLKKTGNKAKGHSVEFLREIAHLRPRTRLIGAVARVRNACAQAVHQFFREREFLYVHTPLITGSDCEGAGEMFQVSTLIADAEKAGGKLPLLDEKLLKERKKEAGGEHLKVGDVDYKQDFFGRPTFLTVSGQLNVETYACALSDVYTFGPTFRAENSNTSRHLAEFWMIEPELCFATLKDDMDLAEDFLKYLAQYVMDHLPSDIDFFDEMVEKGLRDRLRNVIDNPFQRMTYTEAIELLNQPEHLKAGNFEEKPDWGIDLGSEHERYLAEKVYKKPVILTDYPADIKAFYMKQNPLDSKGRLTVQAMDILVPRIGEVVGGSAREEDLGKLEQRIKDMGMDPKDFSWYCDLRRFGTVPHCGFGMGFERLVMFVTGIANIRDVIPFPRHPKTCEY